MITYVVPELYTKKARSFFGSTFALLYLVAPLIFLTFEKCLNRAVSSLSSPSKIILSSPIPASLQAFLAFSKNGFCVASAAAPESFNWKANSATLYPGLAGLIMPPAQCVPQMIAGVSMQLGV